ncbi:MULTISPECIES: hypothetical protein [unclassified Coleofasciculus]|uniref:hypothetical protein n=1 Tax=unclassified Coleofasciculus TaxID=2692782 RepID=UPI001882CAD8|nr:MULTISPECIES: hypothetical protein [unclassified Coleofasciculus]MBE9126480.1 hypothetical protein [Coleofasciculus sp. LEGE 07081]MBE9148918.1 hypothetical protein [Coleofasciculus sp. LEGE 07092]
MQLRQTDAGLRTEVNVSDRNLSQEQRVENLASLRQDIAELKSVVIGILRT